MTKVNKWTLGLAAVGLVSLPAVVKAEEKPNQLLTALSSTTISGYVDTSAHWNPGTGNANPPAYAFNTPSKQDGFNINVVNVVLEKPLDEGTWSAGYKVDLIFGPNAVGWNNSVNGDATSDVGIKQAYVSLRAPVGNGLDLKIGSFDTIVGYEVFNAGSNPNYTRSYGYTIEPTEHTGVLASYQVNKMVGISAGIANTWSAGINNRSARKESSKSYMGAVTLTAPDSMGFLAGSALYLGIVDGYNSFVGNDVTSYYAGGTLNTPIKQLKLGASWDYAHRMTIALGRQVMPRRRRFTRPCRRPRNSASTSVVSGLTSPMLMPPAAAKTRRSAAFLPKSSRLPARSSMICGRTC